MRGSTEDKLRGKTDQAKGHIKEKAGEAMDREDLREEGQADKIAGKVRDKVGDVKKVFNK